MEIFSRLFRELEHCREDEQKQKIEEMKRVIDFMNGERFQSLFTEELFNEIDDAIENEKLSIENAILLLKHIGNYKVLINLSNLAFDESSLNERFKKMMIKENEKKKEEKDEKLMTDLCECYLFFNCTSSSELISICVPCLLKVALKKEESEEVQKEVEMSLLALSCVDELYEVERGLFLNEIKEIIKYHQKHHNLTQNACHSAWKFLMDRLVFDKSLEGMIVNELHFAKEAGRELEDLILSTDWKRKEEENGRKEAKEVLINRRWIKLLKYFFGICKLWSEEYSGLINSIVKVFQASRDNYREISCKYIFSLGKAAENRAVKAEDLLKGGAVEIILEEIQQPIIDHDFMWNCLVFFLNISEGLKEEEDKENENEKRKATKKKMFDKLEEEGYEDAITSFYKILPFFRWSYCIILSLDISDYFVNV